MERFDNNNLFIIKTILKNDRLNTYEKYLKYAVQCGYHICGLEEFYRERKKTTKFFVLRHDVDIKTSATKKMYLKEKELGVRSTYYFRQCTIDRELINNMIQDGFEVGFHYETLANYVLRMGSCNTVEINWDEVKNMFVSELKTFEAKAGIKVKSASSHGHPINRKIHYSNNVIFEDKQYQNYNILFEAYDKEMYEKHVDCHMMDNHISMNYGFSYIDNPIDSINAGKRKIIFLSHPNYWYGNCIRQIKDMGYIILQKGRKYKPRTFSRIANGI